MAANLLLFRRCWDRTWVWQSISSISIHGFADLWSNSRHMSKQAGPSRHHSPFGIAFDIDGVILRGGEPIGGAPQALRRLYQDITSPSELQVPYVFLTNGGGMTESARALELSSQLGVPIAPNQVLLGHTPFKDLASRFKSKRVLAVGKGVPAQVMSSYGFLKVVKDDDYVGEFKHIDPLEHYKPWVKISDQRVDLMDENERRIAAVFVVSDPVDWGRELQVLCDVLRSGGLPGRPEGGPQPSLFFAADDFEYPAKFPVPRFGMGAFRIALESVYTRLTNRPMLYTSYGKPRSSAYKLAESALQHIATSVDAPWATGPSSAKGLTAHRPSVREKPSTGLLQVESCALKTLYMVGDNPLTDICGANAMGRPWFSILVRSGCFGESNNHSLFPADKVVEDVDEAVDFIAKREGLP